MVEEILSLLKKNYFYLNLEKKDATALQDGFVGYIKVIHYSHFALLIYTVLILN